MSRKWIGILIFGIVLASFAFNSGFRKTLERRSDIREIESELAQVESQLDRLNAEIEFIKNNPRGYEELVRKELGYLKKGEKEVRFID